MDSAMSSAKSKIAALRKLAAQRQKRDSHGRFASNGSELPSIKVKKYGQNSVEVPVISVSKYKKGEASATTGGSDVMIADHNQTLKLVAAKKLQTSGRVDPKLVEATKNIGRNIHPIVAHVNPLTGAAEVLHGDDVAASAKEVHRQNPRADVASVYASYDRAEAQAMAEQARYFTPPPMLEGMPKPLTSPGGVANTLHQTRLGEPMLVGVKHIQLEDQSRYSTGDVEAIAQSQVRVGNILPVVVQRVDNGNKFKVVAGGLAVAAGKRAKEIDPKRAESLLVYVAENDQDAEALKWQIGDYGAKR